MRTIFPQEIEGVQEVCTEFAQNSARSADKRVRFPVTIRHRSSTAKIYRPAGKFAYYRVAYAVAGKRRMQTFAAYSDAKAAAERIVRDAANGSQAAALSASQSRDALAALQSLESFRQSTGRAVSLLAAVREFVEAAGKLHGRSLDEAVTGYALVRFPCWAMALHGSMRGPNRRCVRDRPRGGTEAQSSSVDFWVNRETCQSRGNFLPGSFRAFRGIGGLIPIFRCATKTLSLA